jgi:hypothetical protein
MNRLRKYLVVFLNALCVMAHAGLQVDVSTSPITVGEPFQLTLTQDNPKEGGVPNLSGLQKEFIIISTERHMSYTLVNGQSQSSGQWVISLQPKRAGSLFIPGIQIGTEQSAPMTIEVHPNSKTNSSDKQVPGTSDVNLVTEVDEKKPFVNQQIIYTVRLYNSKRLLDASYQEPEVTDALIIPLGDARRYQTSLNNKEYIVEEQSYAIFPQKSGTLTIHSPVFSALLYNINPERIKTQDKDMELKVQPIPEHYVQKDWLPAKKITLSEEYENTSQRLTQGSTLNRSISIEGVGTPAQLLPKLPFDEKKHYTVYPEKGKESNTVQQGELVGRTEMKVTYLFKHPGVVTLPELRVPWFNTQTQQEEVAVLPPRSFEILPLAKKAKSHPTDAVTPSKTTFVEKPQSPASPSWGWVFAALFACAWMTTLALWAHQRRPKKPNSRAYKKALEELNQACMHNRPEAARDALFQWAALRWPDAPLLNLSDLNKLVDCPHLKKQIHELSYALYQSEHQSLWRGDELMRAVEGMAQKKERAPHESDPLPPINPL